MTSMRLIRRCGLTTFALLLICIAQSDQSLAPSPGSGEIDGVVVDADTGERLSNIRVFVEPTDPHNIANGKIPFVRSDADGHFRLRGLKPGLSLVCGGNDDLGYPNTLIAALAFDLRKLPRAEVRDGEVVSGLVLRLKKGGHLTGKIYDGESLASVEGAQIRLQRLDKPSLYLETSPDVRGEFVFVLPPKPFLLTVTAPGYVTWKLPALIGGRKVTRIVVTPSRRESVDVVMMKAKR